MIVKNVAYLYVIQLFRLALPLSLLYILSKTLTVTQYSVYVFTIAVATWLSVFVEYGFNISATRRISESTTNNIREIIIQTQAARWILTFITIFFLPWAIFYSSVFSGYPEWALCAWIIGVMIGMTPNYYYQAISDLRLVALMEVGGILVTVIAVLISISESKDFWRLSIILVLVRLVIWLVLERRMLAGNKLFHNELFNLQKGVHALKDGWRIFLVQFAASLYTSFNIVLLGSISTPYAVAIYGSSERLIRAGLTFIGQATAAIFPTLNKIKSNAPATLLRTRKIILLAYMSVSLLCVPVIWWMSAPISDYFFHRAFPDLAQVIRIMALVVPAIAISNVLAFHYLVVDHKDYIVNWVVFLVVPFSLLFGLLLSREHGAIGMSLAWVAVEWLVTGMLAVIIFLNAKKQKVNNDKRN